MSLFGLSVKRQQANLIRIKVFVEILFTVRAALAVVIWVARPKQPNNVSERAMREVRPKDDPRKGFDHLRWSAGGQTTDLATMKDMAESSHFA